MTSPWSVAAWSLYALTGTCWLPVVYLQVLLSREAARAATVESLPARFHQRFRWWLLLGIPAFTAVILIYYLMIAKPLAMTGA